MILISLYLVLIVRRHFNDLLHQKAILCYTHSILHVNMQVYFLTVDIMSAKSSEVSNVEQIIADLGGCGRFQLKMGITVHASKFLIIFSTMSMIFIAATPQWWCVSDVTPSNMTSCILGRNNTLYCHEKKCDVNGTKCNRFVFSGRERTMVTEVM
jgi:hypothetical protein